MNNRQDDWLEQRLNGWAKNQNEADVPLHFADKVMERIARQQPAGRLKLHFIPVAALVVVALFVLGFSSGYLFRGTLNNPGNEEIRVTFSLHAPEAARVQLVGDFSGWEPLPMQKKEMNWNIQVTLKKGQIYTYNFIVNNEVWIPDPENLARVQDGFGSESTVLKL